MATVGLDAFRGISNIAVIYVRGIESKPANWHNNWNPQGRTVSWNHNWSALG
jgi:hypothetical protein